MSQLQLYVFGPPRCLDGDTTVDISLRKDLALLVYLAVTRQPHSRDTLATLFWPDSDQRTARTNLRRALYRLNKKLTTDVLLATSETIELDPEADIWIDSEAYQQAVDECTSPDQPAGILSEHCLSRLTDAVALYSDDFLAGFTLSDSAEFDDWQFFQTEGLRQSLADVLERLVYTHQARGEFEQAIPYARRRLSIDPLHEPAHRALMQLYAWAGQPAAALRQYDECVRMLDEEFGVPPEDETVDLHEAIRTKRLPMPSTAPAADRYPAAVGVAVATAPRVVSLPLDVAPFVGREEELDRICELLDDPDCRLVTIVGLGGIGKTRLAVTAGQHMAEEQPRLFADGIVFVPLASVESGAAIPSALARALDLSLAGQVDPLTEVSNHLDDRAMLLILDNFEQLSDSAALLTELLAAAPDVKLLVTSREPLYISAEWRLDVEGLPYPSGSDGLDVEDMMAFEAVQLFVQTAQQVQSDFTLTEDVAAHVRRLCQLVAGMPLAVKLAATWLRVMPCERIVEEVEQDLDILTSRLRDVPARQRSMRVVFENTWELLPSDERRAFEALSVFRGTFTEEAAGEVADVSPWLLSGLVDRGLVQYAGETRYSIHELTRQFAAEKLAAGAASSSIRTRHSEYYLQFVASHHAALHGSSPTESVTALKEELDNIRQAWRRAVTGGQVEIVRQAIEPLATFYELAGLLPEGEQLFLSAIEELDATLPADVLCRLLLKRVTFGINRGVITDVWNHVERAQSLVEGIDDPLLRADTYTVRGFYYRYVGDLEHAIEDLETAVALYDQQEQSCRSANFALNILGESKARLQRQDEALSDHERALQIATDHDDLRGQALSLSFIGVDYYFADDYKTALSYFKQAVVLMERVNDLLGVARTVANIGYITCLLGEYDEAVSYIEQAVPLLRAIGAQESAAYAGDTMGQVYFGQGNYAEARQAYQTALDFVLEREQRLEEGWIRNNIARLEMAIGRYDAADRQLQSALGALELVGNPREIAATYGNLAVLHAHREQTEDAMAAFDRAIEGLRETGAKYHLSHVLIEKGRLLYETGDLSSAEPLVVEGIALARHVGRRLARFRGELLLARIEHADGRSDEAVQRLQTLLDDATTDAEKAAVHYGLWSMDDGLMHGRRALDLYRVLAVRTPNVEYRRRLRELQQAASSAE